MSRFVEYPGNRGERPDNGVFEDYPDELELIFEEWFTQPRFKKQCNVFMKTVRQIHLG
jgi:hypothetical protein